MTIGSGGPYVPTHAGARNALPNIRNLINQGKYADAESAINANLLGNPQQQSVYPTIPSDRLSVTLLMYCAFSKLSNRWRAHDKHQPQRHE